MILVNLPYILDSISFYKLFLNDTIESSLYFGFYIILSIL